MRITIDASVFVAAARPAEPHYSRSRAFIPEAQKVNIELICPTLVLPECGAAIARRTGNPMLALSAVVMIDKTMTPDDWLKAQRTNPNQPK
jgi:predicted nucleic acid-binding protein